MRPETETAEAEQPQPATETAQAEGRTVRIPPKPTRAPRKRTPKLDELLAAAVDQARAALHGLAGQDEIGDHVGVVADDDRLVTHRFAATLAGYGGWEWFVTVARAPRSKVVTVCETGLLPGADAILAPDWLPWSERVSQEEKIRLDAIAAGEDPEAAVARARGAAEEDDQDRDQGQDQDESETEGGAAAEPQA
ncbi:DUF3027 domain-containing protein [Citricoccus sp. NPDC055426]|uniref:DUF3027 domain-containing protein n=1 Tax=Citricoccus sp. NPDC055426 TaxID=3155536 RepID=UPI0034455804